MPDQNDPAKEPSEPWEGWRKDPIPSGAGWSVEVHQGPSFTFTSSDGQKYTVNGPDGATCEQGFALLQDWRRGNQKAKRRGRRTGLGKLPATASAGDSEGRSRR